VYIKVLYPDNIQFGLHRTGIFPFNADAVPREYLLQLKFEKQLNLGILCIKYLLVVN
jgi:hypothetical protein